MDELNNTEYVPTVDELVVEDHIVEVDAVEPDAVEPVSYNAPVETPEPIQIEEPAEAPVETPVSKKINSNDNLVALYSAKDFAGISKGYSKVDKVVAQGMLKNKNIRLATEEEIQTHFTN